MARNFSPWAYWQLRLAESTRTRPPAPDAIDTWRDATRTRLAELLGPHPEPVPLAVEVTESVECEHYRRDRIVYDTETAMSVPAYLLVPHEREGAPPGPAVLAIHGHGEGKSMVCDIDDGSEHKRAEITGYNGAYGHELARRGFVVLAPDLRCFGERQDPQWDPSSIRYDCDWNLVCAVMAGTNPLAQNLWDLQRSLDVLCSHPLVDADRVGACGLSYGGTMTLFTAAVDDRVRAAVVSGYLSSWAAAHRMPYNMCGSQVMWGQLGELEHVDIAALIAPRALLAETGTDDLIFPVDAARATVASLRTVYEGFDAGARLEHDVFAGPHMWHGTRAHDFLAEHL
ncbi:MAG TPA: alpha/beta hydrolase family protein [Acidimicrobiia bacterium]